MAGLCGWHLLVPVSVRRLFGGACISQSTSSTTSVTVWFADINQNIEAWRPILKEVADRLHDKVQASATVKLDAAFHEQVQQLVPWKLTLVQIARAPKVRRLPVQKIDGRTSDSSRCCAPVCDRPDPT